MMSLKKLYVCDKCKKEYREREMVGNRFYVEMEVSSKIHDCITFNYHSVIGHEQEICKSCVLHLIGIAFEKACKNRKVFENTTDFLEGHDEDD